MLKLYSYFRSSAAYRVRIGLNFKGLRFETVSVNLRASEQLSDSWLGLNPQGLVPLLQTGQGPIAQSLAILEYLDETHPQPPLLPPDPMDRARARAMALAVACDVHPLNNLRVLNYLRAPLGLGKDAVDEWYRHWVAVGFRALELQARAASTNAHHMLGAAVTIADVCLVPQMYNARRLQCDLTGYPTLVAIDEHLRELPAFAQAAPELQPDAA